MVFKIMTHNHYATYRAFKKPVSSVVHEVMRVGTTDRHTKKDS